MIRKENKLWEYLSLVGVLIISAFLRLWHLDHNGFGNPYYAATVRSMLMNWHNFIYDSYDPTGFVTVDKPPVALWLQTLSAKILGYTGFNLILPQVLEGLISISLVYHLVRRHFDSWAAVLAALAMGLGPICVAVDRFNNVDACLVTVLLFAAWAMSLAVEKGSLPFLIGAMVLVGIGFNVKMVVAFIVLPTFYLLYFLGTAISWKKRFRDLIIASVVLAVVALSWPLFIDLTPADQRPFIGSTQDNSMIGLSLGWNGFQRLLRGRRGPVPATAANALNSNQSNATVSLISPTTGTASPAGAQDPAGPVSQNQNRRRGIGGMGSGTPGPLRLADKNMAGQILWFLPLALFGFFAAWRRNGKSWSWAAQHQALFLWAGWFLTYAAVFSFMKGAMHTYYIVMLAPALAALTGIGVRALWLNFKESKGSWLFAALLVTALWQGYIVYQYSSWRPILMPVLVSSMLIALACLWFTVQKAAASKRTSSWWAPAALCLGLLALFVSPLLWCVSPVLGSGASVEANPDLITGSERGGNSGNMNRMESIVKLVQFLKSKDGHEKYLLVAPNSQSVSPIIINTGEPVIALGGFMGGDPTMTVDEFAQKVKAGQIRYFLLSEPNPRREGNVRRVQNANNPNANNWNGFGRGNNAFQQEVAKWVHANGKPVKQGLWRLVSRPIRVAANNGGLFGRRGMGSMALYDLSAKQD